MRATVEQERVRARILELHRLGGVSVAAIAAHQDVRKGKSTVQMIIQRFGDRVSLVAKKPAGRPSILAFHISLCFSLLLPIFYFILIVFRFRRELVLHAKKQPYWGCGKLGEEVHKFLG